MTYQTRTILMAALALLVVSGLCLIATFGIHQPRKQQAREEMERKLLLPFGQDLVMGLEIDAGTQHTVAERVGKDQQQMSTWVLVEPLKTEGDNIAINSLLGALSLASARVTLEAGVRETYGLDSPRGRIVLRTEHGVTVGLLVGKRSPFDNLLYVQREGETDVLVVNGSLEQILLPSTLDLRSKELISFQPEQVQRLALRSAGMSIEVSREDGVWKLLSPNQDLADAEEVDRVLDTLRNLRALSFRDGSAVRPGTYGLDDPALEIELGFSDGGEAQAISLGRGAVRSNEGRFFARRTRPAGPVAEIEAGFLGHLAKTPFELQERRPLRFNPKDVFQIKSSSNQELLVLERREEPADGGGSTGEWYLLSPRSTRADRFRVESFLKALHRLRASRFLGDKDKGDLAAFGLDQPRGTIVLLGKAGVELGALRIGLAGEHGVFVAGNNRPRICEVDPALLADFPQDSRFLEARPPGETSPQEKP